MIDRLNAALADRYRIEREIGEGGMATVWLADDLKHERKVAIKVLRPELAAVVGAERFLAEIKTTANLEDPHILPLYDSGEADSFLFYVMPYVEGDTLRDRLDRERQLPTEEAVGIARKVAGALAYAHGQGVVHRDIKPANILLRRGEPLVADFGIALALSQAGGGRITETGLSLGTPHYMSPEQAAGERTLDVRSDVYALGCILYEMLTGEPPHPGPTAQAVLAKILTDTPRRITELRRTVATNVDAAVAKALEKLPADRFESAEAFADALADPTFTHATTTGPTRYTANVHGPGEPSTPVTRGSRLWMAAALILGATTIVLGTALGVSWQPEEEDPVLRFSLALPEGQRMMTPSYGRSLALSPDGLSVVYAGASPSAPWQFWHREAGQLEARPIPGSEAGFTPVFSPDGESLAFQGPSSELTISALRQGSSRVLTDSTISVVDWTEEGWLYFHRGITFGDIWRVHVDGGEPEPAPVVSGPVGPLSQWGLGDVLPGGERMVITRFPRGVGRSSAAATVVGIDFESGEVTEIVQGFDPTWVEPGFLVWASAAQDGALMGAGFDPEGLKLLGPPTQIATGMLTSPGGEAQYGISASGSLVYRTGDPIGDSGGLRWIERSGETSPASDVEVGLTVGLWDGVALSPAGTRAAFTIADGASSHLWIQDLERGTPPNRVTFEGTLNVRPHWSPSGDSVTYVTDAGGAGKPTQLWMKAADGGGTPVPLVVSDREVEEGFISPDGEWVVYRLGGTATNRDIYMLRRGVDSVGRPVVATGANERAIAMSPDGRWLAYVSDEGGRDEVFVTPFPEVGSGKWQVSSGGGLSPVWSPDGSALHYVDGANRVVAAEYAVSDRSFSVVGIEPLFPADGIFLTPNNRTFAAAPDGDRFLVLAVGGLGQGIVWVRNWMSELRGWSGG